MKEYVDCSYETLKNVLDDSKMDTIVVGESSTPPRRILHILYVKSFILHKTLNWP